MKQVIYLELLRRWAYAAMGLAALLAFSGMARAEETVSLAVFPRPGVESPITFEASRSNVVHVGNGYMVYGDVWLKTPVHKMRLAGSSLFLEFAPGTDKIVRLVGQAYVPSPYGDDNVVIKRPAMAEVGMDFGANLDRLGVPLNEDRSYLFFNFDAGFEMEVGATGDAGDTKPLTISAPVGAAATLILDPLDPFFYFAGAATTPQSSKGKKDKGGQQASAQDGQARKTDSRGRGQKERRRESGAEQGTGQGEGVGQGEGSGNEQAGFSGVGAGLGVSANGLIPFRPQTTYGIDKEAREFQGHRIYAGRFPLKKIPVEVSGHIIENISSAAGPHHPMAVQLGSLLQAGVNGDFDLDLSAGGKGSQGLVSFGFPLGSATAAIQVINDVQHCYLSGVIDPDTTWIPDWMPIKADAELKTYGYLSSEPQDYRLHMDGFYAVNAATFGEMAGIDLGNVIYVEGLLHVDRHGLMLRGVSDRNLGPFVFQSKQEFEVWAPFNKEESPYLRTSGLIQVGGMSTESVLLINRDGVSLDGRLVVPDLEMQVRAGTGVENGNGFLLGELSVPPQFNDALHGEILKEAQTAEQEVSAIWDEYQQATENYEIELSLRGARQAVPPVCDGIIDGINSGIESAFKKWPKVLGVNVPGKSAARDSAYKQAAPMKNRLARVRDRARSADSESMRAALKSAIQDLLANQTLKISVSKLGTIYNKDVVSSDMETWLRKALAAIDKLPEASNRKIKAAQIWNAAPKREVLLQTKKAIESGVGAVPRIESIGFHHRLFTDQWLLLAIVSHGGSRSEVQFAFDPGNPALLGTRIGQAFVPTL